ncbi:MAG: hemerythrin domain-containing protein [Planctomycetes bacterium]|nr:hemerythrin domain-containing protein [Planctomycetota bacterium]
MTGPTAPRLRMQRATDSLRTEHTLAARALAVLTAIARHVRNGDSFPTQDVAVVLRFLRESLLAVHMRKDTDVVWPALAMHGDESTAARIGELFRLHADVTDLVHSLMLFWEPVDDLSAPERLGFADTVDALVASVRRMQKIEEGALFPACDHVPADDRLDWPRRFAELEADRAPLAWSERIATLERVWSR